MDFEEEIVTPHGYSWGCCIFHVLTLLVNYSGWHTLDTLSTFSLVGCLEDTSSHSN